MKQTSLEFSRAIKSAFLDLAMNGVTLDMIAKRSCLDEEHARLHIRTKFTKDGLHKWKEYNTPTPGVFRDFITLLDAYAIDEKPAISTGKIEALIKAYSNGSRAELFRTSHDFIAKSNGDTPIGGLMGAIQQAADINITNKEMETLANKAQVDLPLHTIRHVIKGLGLPTPTQVHAFVKVCNLAIKANGGQEISGDECKKLENIAGSNLQEVISRELSPKTRDEQLKRNIAAWYKKNHIVTDVREMQGR